MTKTPLPIFARQNTWPRADRALAMATMLMGMAACWAAHPQESTPAAATIAPPAAPEPARPAATSASASASAPIIASGRQSRAWLDQQAGRQQASRTRQTLSGPVMSKVHERYVNSFEQPIVGSIRDTSAIGNRQ